MIPAPEFSWWISKTTVKRTAEIYLDALSLTERITILRKSGVSAVICGAISGTLVNMLSGAKIGLVSDISGEIESVLAAYLAGNLRDSRFRMPGSPANAHPKVISAKE